ncbi:type II secretion system protein J [Yoonia sp. SDW83-1]|uniref:PulJ/GspJ family protein n=1 Tax=Yoonia sp. SDW83-1 TaxID=3366945 RepID=UPI00398C4832
MIRRGRMRGFTLIESLVALAIAALIINGFYSALSTGSLLDRRTSAQAEKVLLATNVIDRVGIDLPLRIGTVETGTQNGLQWELIIGATPTADMQLGEVYPNELIFVSVSVTDPTETTTPVVLRSIRYAQSPL